MSERADAVRRAQRERDLRPVYLDTETTGLEAWDEIIEICVLDHDGSVRVDTLVKPRGRISASAQQVHGLTSGQVAHAPAWAEVWPQVQAAIAGRRVLIYNAEFDLRMLRQTHTAHGLRWASPAGTQFVCLMKLYAQFYGERRYGAYRWQSLEQARRQCRLPLPNAHRARDDALLARAILHYMAEQPL